MIKYVLLLTLIACNEETKESEPSSKNGEITVDNDGDGFTLDEDCNGAIDDPSVLTYSNTLMVMAIPTPLYPIVLSQVDIISDICDYHKSGFGVWLFYVR